MPGDPTARRCEQCSGAMPDKTHRSRNDSGALVCEECKKMPQPNWNTAYSALSEPMKQEMRRREAAALTSVLRIARKTAHDGGDGVTLFHCPFCGSGAIAAGGDGTVTCDFCHTAFSVQVQPQNAGMPQTIDGQPVDMPGMPQGQDLMLDNPDDPSVTVTTRDVAGHLGIQQRSARRVLNRLERAGLARESGRRLPEEGGRPLFLYRLKL